MIPAPLRNSISEGRYAVYVTAGSPGRYDRMINNPGYANALLDAAIAALPAK
jgi:hypothetical protein